MQRYEKKEGKQNFYTIFCHYNYFLHSYHSFFVPLHHLMIMLLLYG